MGYSYFSCKLVRFALKILDVTVTYVDPRSGRPVLFVQIGALRLTRVL